MNDNIFLVGHRGTGKSSLLKRLAQYFPERKCLDLDAEIERRYSKSISEIFSQGEKNFRAIEEKILEEITQQHNAPLIVALGAGFESKIPAGKIIWIRRESDSEGRIFFDRPRLNRNLSPIDEYLERFAERESRYLKLADEVWTLPEGSFELCEFEKIFFQNKINNLGGTLSIKSEHLLRENFKQWAQSWISRGLEFFELRNDLLTETQLEKALSVIPKEKRLISLRPSGAWNVDSSLAKLIDIDVELGIKRQLKNNEFYSWHQKKNSLKESLDFIKEFSNNTHFFKWSPIVDNMSELREIHKSLKEYPYIEFYPRRTDSKNSRWNWYRLLNFKRYKLSFLRESQGTSLDQPTLAQVLMLPNHFNEFAAILGDPVGHSYSPSFHYNFFNKRRMPYFAIPLSRDEATNENVEFLYSLGLRAASVTSPLKQAFSSSPMNTFIWKSSKESIHVNTDLVALKKLISKFKAEETLCWGAGAVSQVISGFLKGVQIVSIRSIENFTEIDKTKIKNIIWCAGPNCKVYPVGINPEIVYDLSYQESSLARDYALQSNAKYKSGLELFIEQAKLQQVFFSEHLFNLE